MKLSELFEAEKIEYLTVNIPKDCDLAKYSDREKGLSIFGYDDGDGSFAQNQDILTLEDISVNGLEVKLYPRFADDLNDTTDEYKEHLQDNFNNWCYEQDGQYSRLGLKKLPADIPRVVDYMFACSYNELTSLDGAPSVVNDDCECHNNNITSLHNIHKIFDSITGELNLRNNPIKSNVLGLLKIKDLDNVRLDDKKLENIINKHLPEGDIVECQSELIEAGFDEFAKL